MGIGAEPLDDSGRPIAGWDSTNHRPAVPQITSTSVDPNGVIYGTMNVNATVPVVANQRVSALAGDFVDGAITTVGAQSDTSATSDTGTFSLVALVKRLLTKFPTIGTQTKANSLSVTIASDQGNIGVSEANSATIQTNTNNTATVLGAITDAAVTGDTAGSISAKQRGLSKILTDIWDSVNHLFHFNVKQWNGAAPSVTNPIISEDQIRAWIIAGQGYQASTGKLAAAATGQAFSVFVPSSLSKNILIYSLKIGYSNASVMHDVRVVTVDPAFANNATISNSKQGGGATNGVTSTYATTTQTASGTVFDALETGANTSVDVFAPGQYYYIPAGTAGGLAVFLGNTAAGNLSVTAKWIEY
jgi:hypothetical protein